MTLVPKEDTPDRRADGVKRPPRFRIRIRDWLIAVVLVALVAAGVAQVIRVRRLRVERELAEAIRAQQEATRAYEALREAEEILEEFKIKASRKDHDAVFPDPDRKGLPDDGRTVL